MRAKIYELRCLCFSFLFFLPLFLFSQIKISPDNPLYDQYKREGKLTGQKANGIPKAIGSTSASLLRIGPGTPTTQAFFKACKEFIPLDTSFDVVPFQAGSLGPPPFYRNDDASTGKITLPFNFCFYGSSYNQLYINNNGNISFDIGQVNFRPDSFPTNDFMAISPFWADVDTRDFNSGVVYYKITPTYMIVTWDSVGYYNWHSDLKNTFQLIITDGTDSTYLSPGNNVGFRYANMEWTTGDIGGDQGFSSSYAQATVGANKSDSIHFVQFGRFGIPGSTYDGPYGGTDGVSWLNGRVMEFNVCNGTNIQPIVNNFNYCDTLYSCVGDTSVFELQFLSPEQDQLTSTVVTTTASSGLTVIQNSAGIVNSVKATFIGDFSNTGYQHIYFSASDNGTPPSTTLLDITVKVDLLMAPLSIAGAGINICPGTTTPLVATAGFEKYRWSNNAITNPMNAGPGDYFVIGKMGKCYLRSDTVHVGALPVTLPVIQGDDSTNLCMEDSTLLTVTNIFPSYSWSNGATGQSAYAHPGNSFVTITDTNGCQVQSAVFHVPQFPMHALKVLGNEFICPGDSATLYATTGFLNYTWSTGIQGTSITVLPGNYFVTALDTNNCKRASPVKTIYNYPVSQPHISGDMGFCINDSALIGLQPGYQDYSWNTGDSVNVIYVQQGTYFATIVDSHQCKVNSDTVTIAPFPILPVTVTGSTGYCPGDSTQLFATADFSSCVWSTGDTMQGIFVHAGTYTVLGIDTNGCAAGSGNIIVSEYVVNAPIVSGNSGICPGDSSVLTATSGFLHYSWSSGDSTMSIIALPGNYYVTAIDSHTCVSQSVAVTVYNFAVTPPHITGPSTCCVNDSALLSASPGFVSYSWNSGQAASDALLPPGVYTVAATDSNNCVTTSTGYTLGTFPYVLPVVNGTTFYCKDDSAALTISPVFPHYTWNTGDTTQAVYVNQGNYSALVTDAHQCVFQTNNFTVQQFPVEVPLIAGKHNYCFGDSVLLQAPANFNQPVWSNGIAAGSIYVKSGNYQLTARDTNNCKSYSLPFAVSLSEPQAEITGVSGVCDGDSVYLKLSNVFNTYSWNTGSDQPGIYVPGGSYSVTVEDSIGCTASDNFSIQAYALPHTHFSHEPIEPEANTVVNFLNETTNAGPGATYTWTINNSAPFSNHTVAEYQFTDSGNYQVNLIVTTANGCTDSYSEIIHVLKTIVIPNIITPNADGQNDLFEIKNLDLSEKNSFFVYDRWGHLVFSSSHYQNNWDAGETQDGVYYFSLHLAGQKEIKGSLTVVR